MGENVSKQKHYTKNGIQPIDYMYKTMSAEEFRGYLRGNIQKYLDRYRYKDGVKDLEKAKVYLEWLIRHEQELPPRETNEDDDVIDIMLTSYQEDEYMFFVNPEGITFIEEIARGHLRCKNHGCLMVRRQDGNLICPICHGIEMG